jgi:cellulose synthase/poly-beta-1,6-N-acetylglucosamine synthase-like glycosyltransferase
MSDAFVLFASRHLFVSLLMPVFYFFATLIVWQGIISLYGGARYLAFVRREMRAGENHVASMYTPLASVIVPCRGCDQGLRNNLEPLFAQQYPAFEIIFVTDSPNDESLAVIEELRRKRENEHQPRTRVVVAGAAIDSGQKVHNLRAAIRQADTHSLVYVFVDTDARPRADWLASLVAALADENIGAATGYRWYVPVKGKFAGRLRAVWNASITSALGERMERNFCWGGSTAIRRETFQKLNMLERWRGTLSDDFALTRALREARLPIRFVPNCLTTSFEDCSIKELFEFTTRQMKITRVYAAHLWKIVLFTNLFFALVFFGGIALSITRVALGLSFAGPVAFILCIYALGTAKAYWRLKAVGLPLAAYRAELRRDTFAHLILWPVASALFLYNALAATCSRRIEWRGLVYELKSPTETIVVPRMSVEKDLSASGEARHV